MTVAVPKPAGAAGLGPAARQDGSRPLDRGRDPYPPIGDYALLSDCHSAALVSRDGSIDWCCFHRFDARPVFSRLLDWSGGGHFRIAPTGPFTVSRRYLPATNVLETRYRTPGGALTVVDCLAIRRGPAAGDAARTRSHHQLLRLVRCEAGQVEVAVEFAPRFDYGLTIPRLELQGDDLGVVYGGADALVLQSELPLTQTDVCGCDGTATLHAGDTAFLALTHQLPHQVQVHRLGREEVLARIDRTVGFWRDWSARCTYDGPYREQVLRSALVLKGLTNAPTGAIVAAPTTSLPEAVGGVRNWDYRYSWLRDAAMNLYALFTLGYTDEAHAFMGWLERTTAGRAEDLQLMYGVGGERLLPEIELGNLDGYRGSRPVRVGNAAAGQFQLDVYGYLLDTAWLYHRHGGPITPTFWELLAGAVEEVARRWTEPDDGIWEVRGGPRHFVASKVMAWVAVDRAIRLARALSLPADLDRWTGLRRAIRRQVEQAGVDPATGAFTQAFGSRALDAANLLLPLVRFLPPDDPRILATVERTARELAPHGLVHRYLGSDDGLAGTEASFVICSFWLVDNLALAGQDDRAAALFEGLLGHANDLGLLAEEVDPVSGQLLGNFPQAFSHVGLISAAVNLRRGRRGRLTDPAYPWARPQVTRRVAAPALEKPMTQTPEHRDDDNTQVRDLAALAADLLEQAAAAPAGRAALTLVTGAGAPLKQTMLALRRGEQLAEHDAPGAATLQVVQGRVRLSTDGQGWELGQGDHIQIPPTRHRLESLEDAAVLLTVATTPSG